MVDVKKQHENDTGIFNHKPLKMTTWNRIALTPGVVYVLLVCIIPVLYLLRFSFSEYKHGSMELSGFTLENYIDFFTDSYYVDLLISTLVMALIISFITIFLAYPVAYYLVRVKSKVVRVVAVLVYLPLMASTVVTSFGWQSLLTDSGFVNNLLMAIGIIDEPLKLMYNRTGVYIAMIAANMPYMVVQIRNSLKSIDPFTIQASKTMGANSVRTFFYVTLPLSLPGISAGVTLVFVSAMSAFVTPTLIGGGRVNTLGSLIYNQVTVAANFQFASAVAFILLVVAFAIMYINNRVFESKRLGGGGR
mgnify:FL=1